MDESVTFWLDNRKCAGMKSAVIGDQQLVLYRDRYYVVTDGAARTRAGKPLRFSTSSLPPAWKSALKGESPLPADTRTVPASLPTTGQVKHKPRKAENPAMTETPKGSIAEQIANTPTQEAKPKRKSESKTALQPPIAANCPYCHARHEMSVEKGKGGKPFFISCIKCTRDFAVRLVPVTIYQAQVAGFPQI